MPFFWDNLKKEHKTKTSVPECFTWLFSHLIFGLLMLTFVNLTGESGEETTQVIAASVGIMWSFKGSLKSVDPICSVTQLWAGLTPQTPVQRQWQITSMGEIGRAECYKSQAFMLQSSKSSPANFSVRREWRGKSNGLQVLKTDDRKGRRSQVSISLDLCGPMYQALQLWWDKHELGVT